MSRRSVVVALCAVVALALVAILAATLAPAAKKHKHRTIQVFSQTQVVTAPGDVGSGTAFCPRNTVATGGGEEWIDGLATVDMGFSGTDAYYVLVDNFDSSLQSVMNVQVACTAGTAKAKARSSQSLTHAQTRDKVADMAAELEAAHRAAE
jgi:hypothetical protein